MLLTSLIILLLSNSLTLRRDKSILFSRLTIRILICSSLITHYYLEIIKQIFFDKLDYNINPDLVDLNATAMITEKETKVEKVALTINNIVIASYLSLIISILTLIISLFMFAPKFIMILTNILSLIIVILCE